jgi:hypothetical protein
MLAFLFELKTVKALAEAFNKVFYEKDLESIFQTAHPDFSGLPPPCGCIIAILNGVDVE